MDRPKIKAGALENLTDARYFAARNVELLGFRLGDQKSNAISILELNAIKEWIEGPKVIAELGFIDLDSHYLINQLSGIDGIQVDGFATLPGQINHTDFLIIREVIVNADGDIPEGITIEPNEIALFDLEKNQVSHDHLNMSIDSYVDRLKAMSEQHPGCYFDLPYRGDVLNQIVTLLMPFGIQLKGSEEEKVGYKSYDDIDLFFDQYEDF